MQETYAYAKTLLDVATSNPDGRTKALLVGGGIANFTDVAATFKGIIQVTLEVFCCNSCRHANSLSAIFAQGCRLSAAALGSMRWKAKAHKPA